jgi:hypothetical protein
MQDCLINSIAIILLLISADFERGTGMRSQTNVIPEQHGYRSCKKYQLQPKMGLLIDES